MVDLHRIKKSDLWYIIGFIATDGYLSSDCRHINITSKDRSHLFLLRNTLGLQNTIGRKSRSSDESKIYSQLQFGDVVFYKYLVSIGLTSKKSLTLTKLNTEEEFFIDFLRGVIDGDGNISTWIHRGNQHRQWCLRIFSGSYLFLEWLREEIRCNLGVVGKIYSRKERKKTNLMHTLKYGKKEAKIILQKVYYQNCLALERKYLKAQLCLQDIGKSGKLYI